MKTTTMRDLMHKQEIMLGQCEVCSSKVRASERFTFWKPSKRLPIICYLCQICTEEAEVNQGIKD